MAFDAAQTWGGLALHPEGTSTRGVQSAAKATTSWGLVRPTSARHGRGTACARVGRDTRLAQVPRRIGVRATSACMGSGRAVGRGPDAEKRQDDTRPTRARGRDVAARRRLHSAWHCLTKENSKNSN
jgi:hypothetical protein